MPKTNWMADKHEMPKTDWMAIRSCHEMPKTNWMANIKSKRRC